jgi:YD repeat-containing protein
MRALWGIGEVTQSHRIAGHLLTLALAFGQMPSQAATIINGDFASGDLSGWTADAWDGSSNPTTPRITIESGGGQNVAAFDTGAFVDDVFVSTLSQVYTVSDADPELRFDFILPTTTTDGTGTGTSPFLDGFAVSLDDGSNLFELLLLDVSGALADPFGTAPGAVTLGTPGNPFFDFQLVADLATLGGTPVTLLIDAISEDDGFRSVARFSNFAPQEPTSGIVPLPPSWLLLLPALLMLIGMRWRGLLGTQAASVSSACLLASLLFPASAPESQAEDLERDDLTDVSALVRIDSSAIIHNFRRRTSSTHISVSNTSTTALDQPLILVIESISEPSVTLANGDGATRPDGRPLVDLSPQVAGDTLDPGEATNRHILRFDNPSRRRFSITAVAYTQARDPGVSPASLQPPSDAQGRALIGIGDAVEVVLTAMGTDPVTISVGQRPSTAGRRGQVFFGPTGTAVSTTVTTPGGADNSVRLSVRGDPERPSAFQGDLLLTTSIAGVEQSAVPITVLRASLDREVSALVNGSPVRRVLNVTPAMPGLTLSMQFFRSPDGTRVEDQALQTSRSVSISPVSGTGMTTDANGLVTFDMTPGPGGQGYVPGFATVGFGTRIATDVQLTNPSAASDGSKASRQLFEDPQDVGPDPISLYSGEMSLNRTDLVIPGRGFDYRFTRRYRSQVEHLRALATGDFGVDWTASYLDDYLVQDGNHVIVFRSTLRSDVFVGDGSGTFTPPQEFYESLRLNADGDFELRQKDGLVMTYAGFDDPTIPGRLVRQEDRNGNFMSFLYAQPPGLARPVLTTVVDTMGRSIGYSYYPSGDANPGRRGRLAQVEDFRRDGASSGRALVFDYDAEGNLVSARSPVVQGTPTGNDFPNGKTERYTYTSGAADPRLAHNLLSVTAPNQADGDAPRQVLVYGEDDADPVTFDRVLSYSIGGSTAGGTIDYVYQLVETDSVSPNSPYLEVGVTDRNGNVSDYLYSAAGTLLERREYTRGLRSGDPAAFVSRHTYNDDKEQVTSADPVGNAVAISLDTGNPDRFANGNVTLTQAIPDPDRGADQDRLFSAVEYEPIYQQPSRITDARGLDPGFSPPTADNCGRSQQERFTHRFFFDYQEADPASVLPLLATELDVDEAEVLARLDAAGIDLGLGDLNGDGLSPPRIGGNIVRVEAPSISLDPNSNQAAVDGNCQPIVTLYGYNSLGQIISEVDAEGNEHVYSYFAETDPDGDGNASPSPADGRTLDAGTGGYLAEDIRDLSHQAEANSGSGAAPTAITTSYTYDDVGNRTSVIDGRGIRTDWVVNELNQVVRTVRAAGIADTSGADPSEPLPLQAFAFIEEHIYDANDNLVGRLVEDRGDTSATGGFIQSTYGYDILDNLVSTTREIDAGTSLSITHVYDANENRIATLHPEENVTETSYDERDLRFQETRGADGPRGGAPATTTYNYDANRNLIERVDAADNGGIASAIAGIGDVTSFLFDGFDRPIGEVSPVGSLRQWRLDPIGNRIEETRSGAIGGSGGSALLAQTAYTYDELNRVVRSDDVLFLPNGVGTTRPISLADGPTSPADGVVTRFIEYDRLSRPTFLVEDDGDIFTTRYDGVGRVVMEIDPEGNRVESAYDDNHNLIETQTTDNSRIAAEERFVETSFYDALDRLAQRTDNLGNTHYYRYDSRDNLACQADANGPPGGSLSRRAFGGDALTTNAINAFGNVIRYSYDGLDRRIREERVLTASGTGDGSNMGCTEYGIPADIPQPDTDQGGGDGLITLLTGWDDNSLVTERRDDNGNTTRYAYDNLNRRVSETKGIVQPPALADRDDPDTTILWEYDQDDNILRLTDENGSARTCQFDGANRKTSCTIARGTRVVGTTAETYQYDGLDRLTRATDNNDPGSSDDDSVIGFSYDSLGRVVEETQQIGAGPVRAVSGYWFAENQRVGLMYPNDRLLEFEYDGLDRLRFVDFPLASTNSVAYRYIGQSRVLERINIDGGSRLSYLNDQGVDSGYDGDRRPIELQHYRDDESTMVGFGYQYDPMDNKLGEQKLHDTPHDESYSYDSAYRILDFERGTADGEVVDGGDFPFLRPDPDGFYAQEWVLDGVGNWAYHIRTEDSAWELRILRQRS